MNCCSASLASFWSQTKPCFQHMRCHMTYIHTYIYRASLSMRNYIINQSRTVESVFFSFANTLNIYWRLFSHTSSMVLHWAWFLFIKSVILNHKCFSFAAVYRVCVCVWFESQIKLNAVGNIRYKFVQAIWKIFFRFCENVTLWWFGIFPALMFDRELLAIIVQGGQMKWVSQKNHRYIRRSVFFVVSVLKRNMSILSLKWHGDYL